MTTTDPLSLILADLARAEIKIRLVGDGDLEISSPRGQFPPELRGRLVAHKADLVRWLSTVTSATTDRQQLPTIVPDPAAADEPFPMSDLQMSFLIGSAEGLEYHVRPHQYMEFDLQDLDVGRFESAVNTSLLRQRNNLVVLTEDMQLERVREFTPMRLPVHDLRDLSPQAAQDAILDVRRRMRRHQLPLDTWPWFDIQVSLRADGPACVHYNNNNFFSDGMGTSKFLENIFTLYRDPEVVLPELEVSFRDGVLALAAIEESSLGKEAERYWRNRIAEWPDAPAVPLVSGAVAQGRSELSRRELTLTGEQWSALKQQARRRGLTNSNVMYAVFAQVISRWSGSRHFLLNNMVTHRQPLHPQIGEVLGNFASLYPLEVDWRAEESFEVRARRLQSQIFADVQHVHWSGVKVLQAFNQQRRTPGRAACPFVISSGLFMGKFDRPTFSTLETPQVLLDCQFWEQDDGSVWVAWDVIESMFPDGVIDAMHTAFRSLLTGLADDDALWQQTDFDLLPPEQVRCRSELNHNPTPPPGGLLHNHLAIRAKAAADQTAVVTETMSLSYGELERRSNVIARSLRDSGARPGSLVAVVLPKGWEQVVAVLGILRAGAAYVPIDPDWPDDRIAHLLHDAGAQDVVTSPDLRDRVSSLAAAAVHVVVRPCASPQAQELPWPAQQPDDLAYVIYTSGSTGKPKGAVLDHRGPHNTILDINNRFGITCDDVVFGVSSLCFDLSVYDIFGPLQVGATLVLPSPSELHNPAAWVDAVRSHGVTVWNSVPALMQLLVEEAEEADLRLPSLRVVLLSGDWIPVDLPARIRQVAPNARVISLGGATEASIWSIYYPIDTVDPSWTSVPYGRPLAGQTWHVLDSGGADSPTWVPGELHIGGAGLAVGYWNDTAKTEASFVKHPRTGERLYRTGDLGRYLPGGDIEFLGRADFQVKIQGFRVEPGEIEHVLAQHPAVRRGLVIVRDTASGKQLSAFAVRSDQGGHVDGAELREYLTRQLPRYMVPATVTLVDQLPLTGNGKVDRRALEALGPVEQACRADHVAPRTSLEATVAKIWESVLDVSPVGVHDDFFDLGGQSFAGLRVITQIARQVGRRLSLGDLLSGRTVEALCRQLSEIHEWSPLVPLRRESFGTTGFLVHPAGGSVLCYRSLAHLLDADWFALQAPGPDSGEEIPGSVEAYAARYVEELRRQQPHGPYLLGGWSSGAVIAAEMTHQLESLGEQVSRLLVLDAPSPQVSEDVDPITLLLWFIEDLDLGLHADQVDARDREALLAIPAEDRLPAALAMATRRADTGVDLDHTQLAHTYDIFGDVVRACRRYTPSILSADIHVVRAKEGRVSEFAEHSHSAAADWGWSTVTTGQVTSAGVAGTHHTLLSDGHVADVAAALADHIPTTRDV